MFRIRKIMSPCSASVGVSGQFTGKGKPTQSQERQSSESIQMLLPLNFLYSDFCWPWTQKYAPKLYSDSCFCNKWVNGKSFLHLDHPAHPRAQLHSEKIVDKRVGITEYSSCLKAFPVFESKSAWLFDHHFSG